MKHWITYPLAAHPSRPEFSTRDGITRLARAAEAAGFHGLGGNSGLTRRRVAAHGDGWNPFRASAQLAQTSRTAPLEGLADLVPMLDHLWRHVDAAGRVARGRAPVRPCVALPHDFAMSGDRGGPPTDHRPE